MSPLPPASKTSAYLRGPLKVSYDKKNDRYYVRIPIKLRPLYSQKKVTFRPTNKSEADQFVITENRRYAEGSNINDLSSALGVFKKCQDEFGLEKSLLQIIGDLYRDLKQTKHEPTLKQIHEAMVSVIPKGRCRHNVSKIKNLLLPWPQMRLSCLADFATRQEKIKELRSFIDRRVDSFTGLPWDTSTKRAYFINFLSVINYGIKQSLTPLTQNPFARAIKFQPDYIPEIFPMFELQYFLTFLWNWEPLLYLAFVLGTWGGLRTTEIKNLTYGMISPKALQAGEIVLRREITKKKRRRVIREEDIPHLFTLLRMLPPTLKMGNENALIFNSYQIEERLFQLWRQLIGRPWPSNAMRHTAASNLLIFTNPSKPEKPIIDTCKRVLGHQFGQDSTSATLFDHYFELVQLHQVKEFYLMNPSVLTPELKASYLWRFYTGWINPTLNTRLWPNHSMLCQHNLRTKGELVIEELRSKRPIFATAKRKILIVETTWPDGSTTTTEIACRNAGIAHELQHRWRVAVYTGQGVLNYETGEVQHYEKNFGPLWKQRLWTLENPEELQRLILHRQPAMSLAVSSATEGPTTEPGKPWGILPVAAELGCASDLLSGYMRSEPQPDSTYSPFVGREAIPERFKVSLKRLFPELLFRLTDITHGDLGRLSAGEYPYCLLESSPASP